MLLTQTDIIRLVILAMLSQWDNCNYKHIKTTSKYVGVCWNKNANKWKARITIGFNSIHLGYFKTEQKASDIYLKALEHIDKYNGNAKSFRILLDI